MRKALKITLYIFGGILLLLLGAVVYLNSPWGQDLVRGRVEAYLRSKLKTEVRLGHLGYGLPKYIVLNDALFLDQHKDTLLSVNVLKIDLNMMQLLHKKVDIQQIVLKGVHSHIYRNAPDTNYNFTYIINAFAGSAAANTTKPKDTSAALAFNIDKITLNDIHFHFDDYTGGVNFGIDLDQLNLKMKKTDLDNMFFHIGDLSVTGLQAVFDQDTSYLPPTPTRNTSNKLKIIADNVDLQHIGFKYDDNLNKFLFALQLGGLKLQLNEYNRDNNLVDVKKLVVENSAATLVIGKSTTAPSPVDSIVKIDTTEGWDVRAKNVDLAGLDFKMDNENEPHQPYGIDYSHLDLHGLALSVRNLLYADTASGDIRHFEVKDKSGVDVREFKTVFQYSPTGAILKNLYIKTPNTVIQDYIEFHYPSLAVLQKRVQSLQLNLNVKNSVVGLHDAALFVPELKKQPLFHKYENSHINLDATVKGALNDLNIAHLNAQGLTNTEVSLSGHIGGLPEPKNLNYNLRIAKLNSSRNDITALLPPNTLPSSLRLPDKFGVVGVIAGNQNDYKADMVLASTDGIAYVKGTLATSPGKGKEQYDMQIRTVQLNVGHIMGQDSLYGEISANVSVKGKSFDIKTMDAVADGNISSAYIKGYKYHDVTFDGKVAAQHATVNMQAEDPNLRMQLNGQADFSGKYAAVIADIRMDSIDFQALKLYKTELRARGRIHADFPVLDPDYPNGSLKWWQPVVVANGKRYFMDSAYVISRPSEDTGQNIFVNLGIFDAHVTGKTPLTKIGAIVQDHINRHYTTTVNDSFKIDIAKLTKKKNTGLVSKTVAVKPQIAQTATAIPADYNLNFTAHVYDKPMLRGFLPGLTSFDSIHIDGSLTPRTLAFNVNNSEVVYGGYTIENASVQLRGNDSALTYKLTVDQVSEGNFALYYADIHGALDNNVISTDISLFDAGKTERFALKANMQTVGDSQIIQLQPGLKLNYQVWDVSEPNRIVFAKQGFYVRNFAISNKGQSIVANNEQPRYNTPLKIDISNFQLSNLTDIASKNDTLLANGVVSGNVIVEQLPLSIKMTGDVQIQNLSIYGDTLGDMHAQVNNKTDDQLDTRITLTGYGNDISLTGLYYLKVNDNNELNFDVGINALALHSFEGLTQHQLSNSSGFLRGNLKIKGTLASPDITGEVHTDNLQTRVAALTSDLKMPAEKIVFTTNKIAFNNFTLQDNAGNKARVDGTIDISELTDPTLDLKVKADNWHAIHSTVKESKELYGDLILSAKLDITGTATVPSVDGSLFILKGTKLTVVNPQTNTGLQSTKGIVAFVNMRDSSYGKALMPRKTDTVKPKHKLAAGSDVNVNITIDKSAEFSLVIDEASGDFINVRGDAYINTSVTPGGVFNLTGNYSLRGGVYQMNYNFIRRRFLIQDGSTITFGGDPLKNTMLDVTAIYEAKTPAYDLVSRQITDPAQLVYFKQALPFNINMHMKGNLELPSFTFDVVLPEDKVYPLASDQIELIQAKLAQLRQDTSEMNKQVFAVLILGRFVSDDPFSSGAATGLGFTAIQSVSTFIGEQLNRAANSLVKGVDLTVDLGTTEDYTTGDMRQRTDLNVAASKRILNDRLKLTVGNDFEVEGPQPNNNSQSAIPSNLAADYLLSGDGRYTVRVYRSNYNEGPLEGYVTETGVNFIVNVDYNRFKTVFMRRRQRKPQDKTTSQDKTVTQ